MALIAGFMLLVPDRAPSRGGDAAGVSSASSSKSSRLFPVAARWCAESGREGLSDLRGVLGDMVTKVFCIHGIPILSLTVNDWDGSRDDGDNSTDLSIIFG